jgi:hypothetical protein
MVLRDRKGTPAVRLDGVHRASTFYGFCSEHDRRLFRPIDTALFRFDPLQAGLLLIRALAHEMSKKEMSLAVARFLRERLGDEAWANDLEVGSTWSHAVLLEQLDLIQAAIIERRYDKIHFNAFVSAAEPQILSSIVWLPDYGFDGARIQRLPQVEHQPGLIGIFSQPHPEGSVCVVAWHESSEWCATKLFGSIARTRPDAEIGNAFLQLQLTTAENVFFVPAWWESISENAKSAYYSWWAKQVDPWRPPDPTQFDALRVDEFRWPVEYVQRN